MRFLSNSTQAETINALLKFSFILTIEIKFKEVAESHLNT